MKSPLLQIPASVSQDDLEGYSSAFSEHVPDAIELPLKLARGGILGLESRLIHLIVQWARRAANSTLVLPQATDAIVYLGQLALSSHGLTALATAQHVRTFDGEEIDPRRVRAIVAKRVSSFDDRTHQIFASEEGYSLLSIYGHPQEHENWLLRDFHAPSALRQQGILTVTSWFAKVVEQVVPHEYIDRFDKDRRNAIAAAIYELLENTQLHGRRNEYAEPLQIGVSGVSVRQVVVPYDAAGSILGGSGDVTRYFFNRLLRDKSKARLFFEVTVFDSGIGYHKWINAPCNDSPATLSFRGQTESETVRSCLLKHATSRTEDGSGVGLFRVTRILKALFGFIRIRTGQTCYYARLDETPDGRPRALGDLRDFDSAEIELREWFQGRALPSSHGTSVTFAFPLTQWRSTVE